MPFVVVGARSVLVVVVICGCCPHLQSLSLSTGIGVVASVHIVASVGIVMSIYVVASVGVVTSIGIVVVVVVIRCCCR